MSLVSWGFAPPWKDTPSSQPAQLLAGGHSTPTVRLTTRKLPHRTRWGSWKLLLGPVITFGSWGRLRTPETRSRLDAPVHARNQLVEHLAELVDPRAQWLNVDSIDPWVVSGRLGVSMPPRPGSDHRARQRRFPSSMCQIVVWPHYRAPRSLPCPSSPPRLGGVVAHICWSRPAQASDERNKLHAVGRTASVQVSGHKTKAIPALSLRSAQRSLSFA